MRIDGAKAWDNLLANGHGRWSNAVERFHSDLMSVVPTPKLKLSATDRFFCIGSCFVRNIELELIYRDILVLSKRIVCPKEEFGHRPTGRLSRSAAIFSIFAGLSGPFSLLFSPVIALRLYETRKECRFASAVYVLLLLEASVQLAFIVFTGRGPVGDQQPAPLHALFELLSRAAGGEERLLLAAGLIAIGLAFTRDKKVAIILIYGCIIVALAGVVRFLHAPNVFDRGAGQRYWYVPSAAMLLVAASFAAAKERTTSICGIVLFVMISIPRNWFDPPRQLRLPDTSWPSAVEKAKSGPVEFTFPPGWKVVIPEQ